MTEHKFLLSMGHGYSAQQLSRKLTSNQDWEVVGTHRSKDKQRRVEESGAIGRIWPGNNLEDLIAKATHLLVSIPPDAEGDPVIRELGDSIANAPRLIWVGYFSTTAVYGDRKGGWVDETANLAPATYRGQLRVEAEKSWGNLAKNSGLKLHIFRLAGIYGPGRGPLSQIQNGRKKSQVIKEGQIFNRIHVEDIARIVMASMLKPDSEAIYNLCDNCPAPPEEVADFACSLLNLEPLPRVLFEDATMSSMARSFYSESKKVSNGLVKSRLAIDLLYPNYKVGMSSLLQENYHQQLKSKIDF